MTIIRDGVEQPRRKRGNNVQDTEVIETNNETEETEDQPEEIEAVDLSSLKDAIGPLNARVHHLDELAGQQIVVTALETVNLKKNARTHAVVHGKEGSYRLTPTVAKIMHQAFSKTEGKPVRVTVVETGRGVSVK